MRASPHAQHGARATAAPPQHHRTGPAPDFVDPFNNRPLQFAPNCSSSALPTTEPHRHAPPDADACAPSRARSWPNQGSRHPDTQVPCTHQDKAFILWIVDCVLYRTSPARLDHFSSTTKISAPAATAPTDPACLAMSRCPRCNAKRNFSQCTPDSNAKYR
ncbi:hypothetical protein BC567DRAFT_59022 [Phyllosticta citribraziliensis]